MANATNNTKNTKSTKKTAKPAPVYSKGLNDVSGVDGYFRPEIKISRWAFGMDIFRDNFSPFIGLNLIMLLFIVPIIILVYLRYSKIIGNALAAPFSANMGVGYLPFGNMLGLGEQIVLNANFDFFIYMPLCAVWLSVGLAGGMFVMRNYAWGESVSLLKVFWKGIKSNFFPIFITSAVYSLILATSAIGISVIDYKIASEGAVAILTIAKIALFVVIAFSTLHYLAMLSMIVTYDAKYFAMLKNTFIITLYMLPLNAFFAVFALLPFELLFFNSLLSFGMIFIVLCGATFGMLVWTLYSQWIYDKFINDSIQKRKATAEEIKQHNDRIRGASMAQESEGFVDIDKQPALTTDVTPVTDYDVKIYDMQQNSVFTRNDVKKVAESKVDFSDKKEEETPSGDGKNSRKAKKQNNAKN